MINQKFIIGSLASLGLLLGVNSSQAIAQKTHQEMPFSNTKIKNKFQRIQQPLWVKGAVTAGGLGLIGLELWWFLGSKPYSQKDKL